MTSAPLVPGIRLTFIDGLRGIAALVVAVGHTIGMVGPDHPPGPIWNADLEHRIIWPWLFGGQMVWLFIMLSGFALYWSEESRRLGGRGSTPLVVYAKRRAWRILPTYYLAFVLGTLVVALLGPVLLAPSPSLTTYGPLTWDGLVAHMFLVHNLSPSWVYQANPPLWSIAVEAQLYLLFPLFFTLRARLTIYGAAVSLVIMAFVLNMALPFPIFALLEWFAAGVVVAHLARRHTFKAPLMLSIALAATLVGLLRLPGIPDRAVEALWLVAFAALMLGLCNVRVSRWNVPNWRMVRWLGDRSYSLYAVHFPIALLAWAIVGRLDLFRPLQITAVVFLGITASIFASALSYRFIERPSLERSKAATSRRSESPVPDPERS